jgi:hypothetical protein
LWARIPGIAREDAALNARALPRNANELTEGNPPATQADKALLHNDGYGGQNDFESYQDGPVRLDVHGIILRCGLPIAAIETVC